MVNMSYLFRLKIDDWQSGRCVSEHNFLSPFCTDHIHTPLTPSVLWWITSAQPMWTLHLFVFVRMKSWNNQMSKCHLCKPAELIMKPCLSQFPTCILYIQSVNLEWATVSPFTGDKSRMQGKTIAVHSCSYRWAHLCIFKWSPELK